MTDVNQASGAKNYPAIEHPARVVAVRQLNEDNFMLTLAAADIARRAEPGQFIDIESSTFLRRPLGIASVDHEAGTFDIGIQVKGEGTKSLAKLEVGAVRSVLGPLGQGFDLKQASRFLVVGGGTGVYPLLYVLEELKRRKVERAAAFGFRSPKHFILEEAFHTASSFTAFSSESGDSAIEGNVMSAVFSVLTESKLFDGIDKAACAVLACGPHPMLRAVAAWAQEEGVSCQISLEERMACGIGYCRTCSCQAKHGPGPDDWNYERVCIEGPVFPAERVFFE